VDLDVLRASVRWHLGDEVRDVESCVFTNPVDGWVHAHLAKIVIEKNVVVRRDHATVNIDFLAQPTSSHEAVVSVVHNVTFIYGIALSDTVMAVGFVVEYEDTFHWNNLLDLSVLVATAPQEGHS
jgi:hypothetical protein